MGQTRFARSTVVLMAGLLFVATPACAQASRTWVSGVGDDANPCSRTAPCKTFAGAISKTAAGGEISVLDPGGFGALTITKAITINGDGTLASILVAGTNAIVVNAGPNDVVIIRHISINGIGSGLNGISFLAGKQLNLENVRIYGFSGRGIDVALASGGELYVTDTNIANCLTGIRLSTSAGQVLATLDNVRLENMTTGFEAASGSSFANIRHSNISGNSANGVLASGPLTVINVEDSMLGFNNGPAVNASVAGATIRLSRNTIYNNVTGISIAGGATVASDGTNRFAGNTVAGAPNAAIPVQ